MKSDLKFKELITVVTLFWCGALPQKVNATLIIALRRNDYLYVASDSVLSRDGQKIQDKYIKCFPASETSCVGISGNGGADGTIQTTSNRFTFDLHFPQKLEAIAAEEYAKHQLSSDSATNILNRFSLVHKSLISILETNDYYTNHERLETDIYFFGYDISAAAFYKSTARFPPFAPYTFNFRKESFPDSSISFIGEYGFLTGLMRGDDPRIKSLKSKALIAALSPSASADKDMQAKMISRAILQLYALHTKYTKRYNYDDGLVGPPYVIYRISTNDVTRIYYGNGLTTSDENVLGIVVCVIVFVLIAGIIVYALRDLQ
jgi:hypothetical protein